MFRILSREIYLRSSKELTIARLEPHADKIHRTSDSIGPPINQAPNDPQRYLENVLTIYAQIMHIDTYT